MHAKVNVCNPSTFCVFPSIAAFGESYIVESPILYPFVNKLVSYKNIHIMNETFLNMKDISEFNTNNNNNDLVDDIVGWLRDSPTHSQKRDQWSNVQWINHDSTIESSENKGEYTVIENVCMTREHDQYGFHFFGLDSWNVVATLGGSLPEYQAWESDIPDVLPFQGKPSIWNTNITMRQFLDDRNANSASMMDGTTIIAPPHHPDNNFHLHNDMLIPVLYMILKSGSKDLPIGHKRRLLLTHGNRNRYDRRVIAFDVLYKLLDEVLYPLEHILEGLTGGVMCFERLILGYIGKTFPYYIESGRFGNDNQWNGVLPEIRDWVNEAHGIDVTQRRNDATKEKPMLTWVDRPCEVGEGRCMTNVSDILNYFSERFNVTLMKFSIEDRREEQLIKMLKCMANTDILVGMHGAGLAHAVYLQPESILVEIKDRLCREKKLFLNMASKQDVGYYLYDAFPASSPELLSTTLNDAEMERFAEDLWSVWTQEQEYLKNKNISDPFLKGECRFPDYVATNESSMLSTFDVSRCYLELNADTGEWRQCIDYGWCNF